MGNLLWLAHENGNPIGNGPTWSSENSTYHQTGVNINVGGSLSASAGGNLVAQGVNANVGGATSLSAVGDMQLTTALNGHVNTFDFLNRYRDSGNLITVEQTIQRSDTQIDIARTAVLTHINAGWVWSSVAHCPHGSNRVPHWIEPNQALLGAPRGQRIMKPVDVVASAVAFVHLTGVAQAVVPQGLARCWIALRCSLAKAAEGQFSARVALGIGQISGRVEVGCADGKWFALLGFRSNTVVWVLVAVEDGLAGA